MQMRLQQEGFALRKRLGKVRLRPWDGWYRVHIQTHRSTLSPFPVRYRCRVQWDRGLIDAEIEVICDVEAIRVVRDRLATWGVLGSCGAL